MSFTIDQAFVNAFDNALMMLSQQMSSRLETAVRVKTGVIGEATTFERLARSAAQTRVSRHADSPLISTTHSRRWANASTKEWGELIDRDDEARILISPTSTYNMTGIAALERAKDDAIITAALGAAQTGKDGTGSQALPAGQKIAQLSAGLSVTKLRTARRLLLAAEVDDSQLNVAAGARQLDDLLADTLVNNKDTNIVAALVEGQVNRYVGFNFIRTERLNTDTGGDRQVIAWGKQGIGFSIWINNSGRVQERADKSFSTYIYVWNVVGAVRIEDEQVVEIACLEA